MNPKNYPLISTDLGRLFIAISFTVFWTLILIIAIAQTKIVINNAMGIGPVQHTPSAGCGKIEPCSQQGQN